MLSMTLSSFFKLRSSNSARRAAFFSFWLERTSKEFLLMKSAIFGATLMGFPVFFGLM